MSSIRKIVAQVPCTPSARRTVEVARKRITALMSDPEQYRFLVVLGLCSIHNVEVAMQCGIRLRELVPSLPHLEIAIRVCGEKPRTGPASWWGYANDPGLDGTFDTLRGVREIRQLMIDLNELGMPVATEFMDPELAPYFAELVSFGWLGARTGESPPHRKMVSGLPIPFGMKNSMNGDIHAASNAMATARESLPGLTGPTRGNPNTCAILRGGTRGDNPSPSMSPRFPNYSAGHLMRLNGVIAGLGFSGRRILIDCGHGNGSVDVVAPSVLESLRHNELGPHNGFLGVMVESCIKSGKQLFKYGETDPSTLDPNLSITDPCLGWDETVELLAALNEEAAYRQKIEPLEEAADM